MIPFDFDVAVIGGGISGLVAARELGRRGAKVGLLEARRRWGGRIASVRPTRLAPGARRSPATGAEWRAIELGAEFVHGRPPETLKLLEQAGLGLTQTDGALTDRTAEGLVFRPHAFDEIDQVLDWVAADPLPDRSLAAWLEEHRLDADVAERVRSFVEGFEAAFADRIGTVGLARERHGTSGGATTARPAPGYGALVDHLVRTAEGVALHLATAVRMVRWSRAGVELEARGADGPRRYRAARAIVTLPAGVLRIEDPADPGCVRFDPPLSRTNKMAALSLLEPGLARRVVLELTDPFWTAYEDRQGRHLDPNGFILARGMSVPVWWTVASEAAAYVTGWVGGPAAAARAHDALEGAACATFARVLGTREEEVRRRLVATHSYDWVGDPWTRGAYTYAAVGGADAPRVLAEPLDAVLFFAGEATHFEGELGTVAAAIASGLRAAGEVASLS